jgi:glucosamine-6-phosphate deaminase
MIEGPLSTDCPASVLQNHKDVVVVLDEAAASKLKNR